jgi:long-chain acyl-CoA synthetase
MVYGDRKPYLTALLTLNPEELQNLCREKGLPESSFDELVRHPEVVARVRQIVDEKNQELARFEQIKKFVILDRDLLPEQNELTPTLKVKRHVVIERFGPLLEALYKE